MPGGIAKALNIEKDEQSSVIILIIQSVFIGFYAGSLDVGAQSLFLSVYDASLIPKAFVLSGIVGIIITSVYTALQTRMKFSKFALVNFVFIAVVTTLLRLGFEFTEDKRLVFAVFVMMGPLTIISFLGFWGTVGRLFTLRQGKRLFGLIDTGQILGIIIVSFAIPVLISLNFEVLNTLFICTLSIIAALVLQIIITRRFSFHEVEKKSETRDNFFDLFKNRYTSLMAFFIVFSVVAAFFVHFSFLTVLEENYPDAKALASFLGAFMGTLTIFTILIKTFVYGKIMKTYGLKLALTLSPVLIGVFTVLAAVIGSIYGYTAASASFAFFFLLIVLSKLFAKSLKDSIEVPSSKILYQSLDINIRYNVQARIDGTVNELAAFSSGLLLAGLGAITFVHIIHFSYSLLLVLVIWFFIGLRLYRAYQASLENSLKQFRQLETEESEEISLLEKISPSGSDPDQVAAVLEFAPQAWNGYVSRNFKDLFTSNEKIRDLSLKIVDELDLTNTKEAIEKLIRSTEKNLNSRLKSISERFKNAGSKNTDEEIRSLLKSEKPEDRKKGILSIIEKNDPAYFPRIVPLFRDASPEVRLSAIHAAGVLNRKDFVTYLVDLLEDPKYYSYAFNSLCMMNADIFENLEHGFHKTGITETGMARITRVFGAIGTESAGFYLFAKLEHYNRKVFSAVLEGIRKLKIKPSENDRLKVFNAIYQLCGITAWNLFAKYSLRDFEESEELIHALEDEISENYDLIYSLLSVAYDAGSVFHIRQNLESGTAEGIGFAIELLDMFIDESIKSYLFPLLDDSPMSEKLRLLQTEYPVEMMKPEELLRDIINRDYNYINAYTRVCAIHALDKIENVKPGDDLIAQVFNTDPLLREEAAGFIYRRDRELLNNILGRLPEDIVISIKYHIEHTGTSRDNGLFRKFSSLLNHEAFINFKKHHLLNIARSCELFIFEGKEENKLSELFSEGDFILVLGGEFSINAGKVKISLQKDDFSNVSSEIDADFAKAVLNCETAASCMKFSRMAIRELIFDDELRYFPLAEILVKKEKIK